MNIVSKILLVALLGLGLVSTASATIHVENLPASISEEELKRLFSDYGKVMKVRLVKDEQTGQTKGEGFVHMGNFAMEKEAIESLNNKKLGSHKLKLSKSAPRTLDFGVSRP